MTRTAYKFLDAGRIGPVSGFAWPEPGEWVEATGPLALCENGIHVCRTHEVSYWLAPTLWQLEHDEDTVEGIDCFVVRRARLVREITTWREGGAQRLVEASLDRARAQFMVAAADDPELVDLLGDGVEAADRGQFAVAAYLAALVAARATMELSGVSEDRAFVEERRWQSSWIARGVIGVL